MSKAALPAVVGHTWDGPRPEVCYNQPLESRISSPPPFPPSATATQPQPTIGATVVASTPSEPHDVEAQVSPPDSESSGWHVLMGAVNLELKRTGPMAPGSGAATATAQQMLTGTAFAPSSSSASPMVLRRDMHVSEQRQRATREAVSVSGRADAYFGGKDIAAACRALTNLPHVPVGHAPESESRPEAGGTGAVALPGFSMTKGDAVPPYPLGVVATPATASDTATNSSPRVRMIDFVNMPPEPTPYAVPAASPPPLRPPPLGPTARDIYAANVRRVPATTTATVAVAVAASPGLPHGGVIAPPAQATGNTTRVGKATKNNPVKAKVAKAKPAKPKAPKKTKAAKARERKLKAWCRRGPPGQSSFKGVCITPAGTWRAVIYVDRKQKYLGVFDSEFDAARAYDAAAMVYCPGSQLNNPDVIERQLNELSAGGGKPFATAGAPTRAGERSWGS